MGNSSSREARNSNDRGSSQSQTQSPTSPTFSFSLNPPSHDRHGGVYSSRGARGSRNDLGLFSVGGSGEVDPTGQRKETKQEREARKLEKERLLRARERERSLREEGVDGGYLVTLGTYVGPEDFSKISVRQLQIERRLAPFWRGLNDHSDSWTEHQLVAAARGQPIPPPDEIPPQDETPSPTEARPISQTPASQYTVHLEGEISQSSSLQTPAPHDSKPSTSPSASTPSPLFRGRTKPVASISPGMKDSSQPDIPRNEIRLPPNPQINGQPLEAYLYKDVRECPICFLYYPPYLNRTRCCDQPICSECFVQIKRPDPHPPEHTDPHSPPPDNQQPQALDGADLVSEPATCPFCKMPELGITYDSPPFRRGLAYVDSASTPDGRSNSTSVSKRARGQSMSVNHPTVITTDTVRPDWSKKLADARSHQARRSAAATALHTAAYMMNDRGSNFPGLGRRRRNPIIDYNGEGSSNRPENMNPAHLEQIMAALENQEASRRPRRGNSGGPDLFPLRNSSRNRPEDLEELMMMEAIRLSLQAEEERKKKEEKEAEKERKKEEKKRAKEQKKEAKAARKTGSSSYSSSRNNSQFFSHTQSFPTDQSQSPDEGKGKARASGQSPAASTRSRAYQPGGFNPLDEPTSTLNTQTGPQRPEPTPRYLEQSRSAMSSETLTIPPGHARATSFTSTDSSQGDASSHLENNNAVNQAGPILPPIPTADDYSASSEGMFNFTSLNEMIDREHLEDRDGRARGADETRSRGASSASQTSPPQYPVGNGNATGGGDGVGAKHGSSVAVTGHTEET